jgi:hypothetical protein
MQTHYASKMVFTSTAGAGAPKTSTLKVPGATLYYEVRGSGPVLLLICGGCMTPPVMRTWPSSSPTATRW